MYHYWVVRLGEWLWIYQTRNIWVEVYEQAESHITHMEVSEIQFPKSSKSWMTISNSIETVWLEDPQFMEPPIYIIIHVYIYCIILYYILYYIILYYILFYYIILYYILFYYIILYYIILCYIISFYIISYRIISYYIIIYYIILYYIISYDYHIMYI